MSSRIVYRPLTANRWTDLVELFGPRGACAGCWCMYWRLSRPAFQKGKGTGNRSGLRKLVLSGPPPGLLAYVDGRPAGWCAIGPRDGYPRLETSRVLARVDESPVWSVVCFYVAPGYRRRGLTAGLLRAAASLALRSGARAVEGYPIDSSGAPYPPTFAWTGLLPAFEKAGFTEVARRSPKRPIMRCQLEGAGPGASRRAARRRGGRNTMERRS